MKPKKGLTRKIIIAMVAFTVVLTTVTIIVGINVYKNASIDQYTTTAYQIADTAKGYFTDDQLKDWAKLAFDFSKGNAKQSDVDKVVNSEQYKMVKKYMDQLQESTGANDIFFTYMDMNLLNHFDKALYEQKKWTPIVYVMDSYHVKEEQFGFGDASGVVEDYINIVKQACETGKKPSEVIISEGSFGYNTTAILPIVQDGKTVANIWVEIPMSTLKSSISTFIYRVILFSAIVLIVLLSIAIAFVIKMIINPIKLVANEASRFVQNNNEISRELEKIKSKDEIKLLSESLLKLEMDVNDYIANITAITAEKERIGAELDVAKKIQANSLPTIFPAFPERDEFDIYATMDPAKEVGGDFYDFYLIDDDHLVLTIADVSGKGVPAALFMMISKTLLKNQSSFTRSPKEILEVVNNQLCENNEAEMFVTVWLGILEISTGKVVAANAGHEFPTIKKADAQFELLRDKHGFVLAGMEDMKYQEYEFVMEPGEILYVYTDGVAEATNAQNELYGTERMLVALNQEGLSTPEELLVAVRKDIDAFVKEAPQFDDITMLALKYTGNKK